MTIIANPEAYKKNKRFIEKDMNRSFRRKGRYKSYEEKRADEIYKLSKEYNFVVDVHTTTSDIDFVPIMAGHNNEVRRALSHLPGNDVAQMEFDGVEHSLIGSIDSSLSIEFNEVFAKTSDAIHIVDDLITGLRSAMFGSVQSKTLYHIVGTIPEKATLNNEDKNFKFSKNLGYFPFLIGEKHYRDIKDFTPNISRN